MNNIITYNNIYKYISYFTVYKLNILKLIIMKDKLSLTTINQYRMMLRLYCYDQDLLSPNETFINLHFKISDRLKTYISKETLKTCLGAIMWKIKSFVGIIQGQFLIDQYCLLVFHMRALCSFDVINHRRNSNNIPIWSEILKRRDHWKSIYETRKYVVGCVYTMIPPRRVIDYGKMFIIDDINNITLTDRNYYSTSDNCFIFYSYKTKESYGRKIIKLPNNLNEIIKDYIKINKLVSGESLFQTTNMYDNQQDGFKQLIHSTFNCGVDVIRHSYINFIYSDDTRFISNSEMEETSKNMGHSVQTQLGYRKIKSDSSNSSTSIPEVKIKPKIFSDYKNPNVLRIKSKKNNDNYVVVNDAVNAKCRDNEQNINAKNSCIIDIFLILIFMINNIIINHKS